MNNKRSTLLLPNGLAQELYSIAYLYGVCAQACLNPDSIVVSRERMFDRGAVDTTLKLKLGFVELQLKCRALDKDGDHSFINKRKKTVTIPLKEYWLESWRERSENQLVQVVPLYIVVVFVPHEKLDWIEYLFLNKSSEGVHHNVSAYWGKVNNLGEDTKSIQIPMSQAFTPETLKQWDTLDAFKS